MSIGLLNFRAFFNGFRGCGKAFSARIYVHIHIYIFKAACLSLGMHSLAT